MEKFKIKLNEIYDNYRNEYLSYFDNTPSSISERNNKSHLKEIKEKLRVELIYESLKFSDIEDSVRDNYISELLLEFVK